MKIKGQADLIGLRVISINENNKIRTGIFKGWNTIGYRKFPVVYFPTDGELLCFDILLPYTAEFYTFLESVDNAYEICSNIIQIHTMKNTI